MNACRNTSCDGLCVPCTRARVCVPALSTPPPAPLCKLKKLKPKPVERVTRFKSPAQLAEIETRKGFASNPMIPHGTRSGYSHHRCLCAPCVKANKAWFKVWRAKQKAAK